ncbi:hypothetical protein ACS0TY_001372 [Phlomoides rotata]
MSENHSWFLRCGLILADFSMLPANALEVLEMKTSCVLQKQFLLVEKCHLQSSTTTAPRRSPSTDYPTTAPANSPFGPTNSSLLRSSSSATHPPLPIAAPKAPPNTLV